MELSIHRKALSIYFFLSGICFASWASRIPTIKQFFSLSDAELGSILLVMPISSLIGLPLSGWFVSKFDSRVPLIVAFICHAISLMCIGYAHSIWFLIFAICLFSFSMRIANICINTQSITLQKRFEKRVVGSFHGLWSLGGLVGVGLSTLMVANAISIAMHLFTVAIIAITIALITFKYMLKNDKSTSGNKLILNKPDAFIVSLGIMVFLGAICEGGMFDWSGVYFKEVLQVSVFTYGYLMFMVTMTISRFLSDKIVHKFGIYKTYAISGILIFSGIVLAVVFKTFISGLLGFLLVGLGTAAIFPLTISLAGLSKKYSAGMAVSIISTYSIFGMLIGPPLIGYLSHGFGLDKAFILFAIIGLLFIPVAKQTTRLAKNQ